jgi:hypothetical protein
VQRNSLSLDKSRLKGDAVWAEGVWGLQRLANATQSHGWTHIEARSLGELSAEERAAGELEENLHRKDLTPAERMVASPRRMPARVASWLLRRCGRTSA